MSGLSNRAMPKYYKQFRDAVMRGEIPVCEEIVMEMNRIDALIANPYYYYDPKPVEGFIAFCENELTLTDGSDLKLLPTFKLWAEQIWCWYYFEERPVFDPEKGRHVTKIIKQRLTSPAQILDFDLGGYAYCPELSTPQKPLFRRAAGAV